VYEVKHRLEAETVKQENSIQLRTFKGTIQLFMTNPSQSYAASPAMWDHTVLPAAGHG